MPLKAVAGFSEIRIKNPEAGLVVGASNTTHYQDALSRNFFSHHVEDSIRLLFTSKFRYRRSIESEVCSVRSRQTHAPLLSFERMRLD
jgi:hypothetical protein